MLLLRLGEIPKTHGAIIQKFGEIYIKSGIIGKDVAREVSLGLDLRNRARYNFRAQIAQESVSRVVATAETLVQALEDELQGISVAPQFCLIRNIFFGKPSLP